MTDGKTIIADDAEQPIFKFETYTLREEDCEHIWECVKQKEKETNWIAVPLIRTADNRQIHYDSIEFPSKHKELRNYVSRYDITQYQTVPEHYVSPRKVEVFDPLPNDEKQIEAEKISLLARDRPLTLAFLDDGDPATAVTSGDFSLLRERGMQLEKYRLKEEECEYIWEYAKRSGNKKREIYIPIIRNADNKRTHYDGVIFPPRYKELEKFVWLEQISQYKFPLGSKKNREGKKLYDNLPFSADFRRQGGEKLYFTVFLRPSCVSWLNGRGSSCIIPDYTIPAQIPSASA